MNLNHSRATRQPNVHERHTAQVVERRPTPEPPTHSGDSIARPHINARNQEEIQPRAPTSSTAGVGPVTIRIPNVMEPTTESRPSVAHGDQAQEPTISSSAAQPSAPTAATLAVRISNIKESTTEDDLKTYFANQKLELSDDHSPILFAKTEDDSRRRTTVSFNSEETLKLALSLPRAQRKLDGLVLDFDSTFLGFTVFSEGTEVE